MSGTGSFGPDMDPTVPLDPTVPTRASRLAVLASGSGTLLDAMASGGLPIAVVVDGELVHSMYRDGGFPASETIVEAVRARLG